MIRKTVFLSIAAIVCLSLAGISAEAAKPKPPKELMSIFKELNDVEEAISDQKWEKASSEVAHIKSVFRKVYTDVKGSVSAELLDQFTGVTDNLKSSIDNKSKDNAYITLSAIQLTFVKIMINFDYQIPPALTAIEWNIDEAVDEMKEKEYDDIRREMAEIVPLFLTIEPLLKEKGISQEELADFKMSANSARNGAISKDWNVTMTSLKKIKAMTRAYVKLFK